MALDYGREVVQYTEMQGWGQGPVTGREPVRWVQGAVARCVRGRIGDTIDIRVRISVRALHIRARVGKRASHESAGWQRSLV